VHYLKSAEFIKAIDRNVFHTRSRQLQDAVDAIKEYEKQSTKENIKKVSKRLRLWKMTNRKEFQDRGAPIEAPLRQELKDEFGRHGLKYVPGTTVAEAQPFLYTLQQGPGAQLAALPMQANLVDPRYYYHATKYGNLPMIKANGLDPSCGGQRGASEAVHIQHFIDGSRDKVHASTCTNTSTFYAAVHDKKASFLVQGGGVIPRNPVFLKDLGVILRFSRNLVSPEDLENDPDDPDRPGAIRGAWRIYSRISPLFIEALTTEGWVPIRDLVELDAALDEF
jgi:hypothetical protein